MFAFLSGENSYLLVRNERFFYQTFGAFEQVFLSLSFDDDLLRDSTSGGLSQSSVEGSKKPPSKLSKREEKKGKKAKKQLAAQLRKEVYLLEGLL